MRGRSKICFRNTTKNMLQGVDEDKQNNRLAAKADWLRRLAQDHAAQGNRLTNIARRMKVIAGDASDSSRRRDNRCFNQATLDAYNKQAKASGAKENLTEQQKKQIAESWKQIVGKKANNQRRAKPAPRKKPRTM